MKTERVKGFNDETWKKWRYQIVVNGNYLQFSQNKRLKKILLNTGDDELVEASPFDRIWGVGYNMKTAPKISKARWGLNLLGKALVEVRDKLN